MKRFLLLSVFGLAGIGSANAAVVIDNTLSGIPQTANAPCVIGDASCGAGSRIPPNWTFNQQSGTPGIGGNYDLTSPLYTAANPFTTFSGNTIPTSFDMLIDDNVAKGQGVELLNSFKTFDCGTLGTTCVLDAANSYQGPPVSISDINGNGFSDTGLTRFNVIAGHQYKFEASVSNDSDGMEEFFISNATNSGPKAPEPASLVILGVGLLGLGVVARRRKEAV